MVTPAGVFKHSQSLSQAYLATIISSEERGIYYGYFTASSNIGFIVGPLIGGHLAELSNGFFWLAVVVFVLFLLNAAIVWKCLPVVETKRRKATVAESNKNGVSPKVVADEKFLLARIVNYSRDVQLGNCWDIMTFRLVLGFSTLIYRSSFSLVLEEQFGFTPKYLGYLTSYQGIVSALVGFFVGYLIRVDSNEDRQVFYGVCSLFMSLLGLTFAPGVTFLLLSLTVMCISTSFLRVCLSNLLVSRCSRDKIGAVVGLGQSVTSAARMLAPLAGGMAMEMGHFGPSLVGTCSAGVGLVLSLYLCIRETPKQKVS